MKIAILDLGWASINPYEPFDRAQGGSETWFIQVGQEFANQGNTVHQFFKFTEETIEQYKVNENLYYYNQNTTFQVLQNNHYDFVILSRFTRKNGVNYVEYIKQKGIANHMYLQLHDLSMIDENNMLVKVGSDVSKYSLNDDFLTIVALNEWHMNNFIAQYHIAPERFICAPNGIDFNLFKTHDVKKDNRVLWSSCKERGLDILVHYIYPMIKPLVPDFGIDVASYQDLSDVDFGDADVRILGKLNKEQLYAEQKKHKVWFYPGTFAETFCITLIENIMNGAYVVSPLTFGTSATLGPFVDQLRVGTNFWDEKEKQSSAIQCAREMLKILQNKNNHVEELQPLYDQIKQYIHENYNWKNTVSIYLNDYKSRSCVENLQDKESRKIIFLSMSCNMQFFKDELEVIKDTWAKPILDGQVPNASWYAFTSCDSVHTKEGIDEKEHMVYVDFPDDLSHTYHKMERAYQLLHDRYDFDILVRTNTSMYLNLEKILEISNSLKEDEISSDWISYYLKFPDKAEREFQFYIFCGNCYVAHRSMLDKIFYSGIDKNKLMPWDYDDVVTSRILYELRIPYKCAYLNPNPSTYNTCLRYKICTEEDKPKIFEEKENEFRYTDDPDEINNWSTLQCRCRYEFEERRTKGHEFEHLREIHEAYLKKHHKYSTGSDPKHLKYLMLSMSCNQKDFLDREEVVKDTWAKPVIENKYPGVAWFAYRSCDENHPFECIDNHVIYLNTLDDLKHTWSKTKRVFQFLHEQGYTWEFCVRTNTSVYWNVENLMKCNFEDGNIYSCYGWSIPASIPEYKAPSGWAMILPNSLTEYICNEKFDESFGDYKQEIEQNFPNPKKFNGTGLLFDDVMIGALLWCIRNKRQYNRVALPIWHYKCVVPFGYLNQEKNKDSYLYIFDKPEERLKTPEEINNVLMAQVRCWGTHPACRYFELEHMYELENAIKRTV